MREGLLCAQPRQERRHRADSETLAGAYAIVESLGSPSNAPTEAAVLLEQFIETGSF